ncbi:uncharacterized protein DNG_09058 [Cephalotrichum gorgonifer]|uniref:Ketoreductase domain-containing protein n=1 Tax=Cephalotrichum gorgonifer TaxID=2041049 RepID=A0AAE8N669_9PEZI|nr:uncharacterized protein DNG_09058 [Cephalotrichum gorgonifer]
MNDVKAPLLGLVLVTGGCGFLGYALVRQLLDDAEVGQVHIVDRKISHNRHDGAHYHECTVTDRAELERLFQEIRPNAVFHLASPTFAAGTQADQYDTNVEGTKILLEIAADCPSTKAFVHCSSVDVYADAPHVNVDETQKTWVSSPHAPGPYEKSKAIADGMALAANGPRLATASLRGAHMYGPRCSQGLPPLIRLSEGSMPLFQMGPGTNMVDCVSSDNAAAAHILAAKALLDHGRADGEIAGEAFNICDGEPMLFWHHTCLVWNAVRGRDVAGELIRIPEWLARLIFGLVRWVFLIFTAGYVDPPPNMGSTPLSYALEHRTYDSRKARERLGFRPTSDHEEVIRQAVDEALGRQPAK